MIGIVGFLCEHKTPGSVPILKNVIVPYDGQVMAPFEYNWIIDFKPILEAWGISIMIRAIEKRVTVSKPKFLPLIVKSVRIAPPPNFHQNTHGLS